MLGVYIHIPFCIRKCFYCDFYSIETKPLNNTGKPESERHHKYDDSQIVDFISAVQNEIRLRTNRSSDKIEVSTIFLGGGTPSLLSENQIRSLFYTINKSFEISNQTEITIECNPGTLTADKLKLYRELGINRLSIGVQSFNPEELKFLQRIHSTGDVVESFRMARDCGFNNISIDLIFSIPGQTKNNLVYSLEKSVELNPDHISAYSLIFEKGTPLFNEMIQGKIRPVDEIIDAEFYEIVIDYLTKYGYEQYEVSNFAKESKYCHHNLKYWHNEEYLAFGPSAHGFYDNIRYNNISSLKTYVKKLSSNSLPTESEEYQTKKNRIIDTIFLGLRSRGIRLNQFINEYNLDLMNILNDEINFYMKEKHMVITGNCLISLTKKGYQVCDTISVDFINKIEKYLIDSEYNLND